MNFAEPLTNMFNKILSWIPDIIGAILILIIGYFIAMGIKALVVAALRGIKLNKRLFELKGGRYIHHVTDDPASLIGSIVYWLVWILVLTIAIPILNIPVLNQLIFAFYAYLPNIIAAFLILIVAGAIAGGIAAIVAKLFGDTPTGKVIATLAPTLVMTIATFMILVQLKIATPIIIITYAALWGALALGFALAFGLGGRDVAARLLDQAYRKSQKNLDKVKEDLNTAKNRGKEEVNHIKEEYDQS